MNILCTCDTAKTQVWITFERIHFLQFQYCFRLKMLEWALTRWVWIISFFNDLTHFLLQMLALLSSDLKHFLHTYLWNDALKLHSSGLSVAWRSIFLNLDLRWNTIKRAVSLFGYMPLLLLRSGANVTKRLLFWNKIHEIAVHWLIGLSFFLLYNLQSYILKIWIMLKIT